jgi:uncharacterized membrane protein YdfJ with MMPL/SSD domain
MNLLSNWREILKKAWSVRFMAIAVLFSAIEVAVAFLPHFYAVPTGIFATLSIAAAVAALIARFIAQKTLGARE